MKEVAFSGTKKRKNKVKRHNATQRLLENYDKRSPSFSPEDATKRMKEMKNAYESAVLSGAPPLNRELEKAMSLLAYGKISDQEYYDLCKNLHQNTHRLRTGLHN